MYEDVASKLAVLFKIFIQHKIINKKAKTVTKLFKFYISETYKLNLHELHEKRHNYINQKIEIVYDLETVECNFWLILISSLCSKYSNIRKE